MAVSLSQNKIKAHRISFAKLSTPDAFKKALDLVEQLSALNPLLTEMHRRELVEQLGLAIPISSAQPSRQTRPSPKNAASPPVAAANALGMVDCPQCNSSVRADRLDRHLRKIHQTVAVTAPKRQPVKKGNAGARKTTKEQLASARNRARSTVICGDCNRSMTREDYAVHICKVRGRGWEVQGGAPGLRRR